MFDSHVAYLLTLLRVSCLPCIPLLCYRKNNLLKFEANNIRLLVIRDTEQGIKKLFDSQVQYDGTVSQYMSWAAFYHFFVFVLIHSQKCNVPKVPLNYRQSDDSGFTSRSSSFSGCSNLSGSFVSGRIRSNSDRVGNVVSIIIIIFASMYAPVITCLRMHLISVDFRCFCFGRDDVW